MQETRVRPLGLEDPLEKGMATHCSILAWRILWTEEWDTIHEVTKGQTWLRNEHTVLKAEVHEESIYIIVLM